MNMDQGTMLVLMAQKGIDITPTVVAVMDKGKVDSIVIGIVFCVLFLCIAVCVYSIGGRK